MRFIEISKLMEAELSAGALTRRAGRTEAFIQKIRDNGDFPLTTGETVKIAPEEADRFQNMLDTGTLIGAINVKTQDGRQIPLGKFIKTTDLGGKLGGGETVGSKGDVAEGILAAAMFAKLAARVNTGIDAVTADDVWNILEALKMSGTDQYSVRVKDKSKTVVNDEIRFTLKLGIGPYTDLMDPKKRGQLTVLTNSALLYANSDRAAEFSKYYYLNGKPDVIDVISDGISDQKGRKTDVEVYVTDPKTGKRDRKHLNISLKADSPQVGQVGGWQFEKLNSLFSQFGVDMTFYQDEYNQELENNGVDGAIAFMYQEAAKLFQEVLAGDYDEDEYVYVSEFVKGITYFTSLNDPTIELVDLASSGRPKYKVLKFDNLQKKLSKINLSAVYNATTKNPRIDIFDVNSKRIFITIRHKTEDQGKVRRNYIEKGPLLAELASVI